LARGKQATAETKPSTQAAPVVTAATAAPVRAPLDEAPSPPPTGKVIMTVSSANPPTTPLAGLVSGGKAGGKAGSSVSAKTSGDKRHPGALLGKKTAKKSSGEKQ
jgi:hypothetical protein